MKHGDLEITFKQLLVGVDSSSKPAAPPPGEGSYARLEFDLKVNGEPTEVWVPVGVELADATGNKTQPDRYSSGTEKGTAYVRGLPYLWSSERAWKVRTEFMRNERGAFTTNELIEVRGLAVPPPHGVTTLNLSTNRLGHVVRVLGLAQGKGHFGTRNPFMSEDGVTLELDVLPSLGANQRLIALPVRDDQGRTVKIYDYSKGGSSFTFWLAPRADAQTLDFTLAVQEVVTAEFLVKPVLFKPSASAAR